MNIRTICTVITLLLATAAFAEPSYVVLNSLGETISAGEWLSAPTNDIFTVGSMPNQIFAGSDRGIWIVASGPAKIQEVSIAGSSGSIVDEYALPLGSNPYLMFEENGKILTSLWVTGGIGIIDIASSSVTSTDSFCLGPQGVFADSDYIYVTAGNLDPVSFVYGEGELWRLDWSGVPIDHIGLGINPQQIIRGPDGNLHIVCTGDYFATFGVVYIVDPISFSVVDSVILGGSPQRLSLDRSTGTVYSATSIWGTYGSGRLLAYDGETHEVLLDSDDTGNALSGTGNVGLAAFDGYVFVPSMDSSWIEIVRIDETSMAMTPVARYNTGYGPLDVALFDPTDIEETALPKKTGEPSIAPSPFNSSCRIVAPKNIERARVLDISGRLVDKIPTIAISGNEIIWTPSDGTPSGIYLVELFCGSEHFKIRAVYLE
ncbi:hypothetical protein J7L01_07975 [bacterium]|nr:hypothetical protein [bacterium]